MTFLHLLISFVVAAGPTAGVALALWLMLGEKRPRRQIPVAVFLWGVFGAAPLAILLQTFATGTFSLMAAEGINGILLALLVAPWLEELLKALGWATAMVLGRGRGEGPAAGLVHGVCAGAGFAMSENFLAFHGILRVSGDLDLWRTTLLYRTLGPAMMHLVTGAVAGTLAARGRPILGLLAAIVLHLAWNAVALGWLLVRG
jgi:RsiW-degrading membrane proteinase PrsW (M82 family)